jgi:RNA polymerase sigma factor FliA
MMVRSEAEVQRLVHENRKLVHYVVNRYLQQYWVGNMERDDLVSWGMIGLVQAARSWDPARAGAFSTLACKAIERMIIRGVRREWKPDQAAATLSLDELIISEAGEPPGTRRRRRGAGPQRGGTSGCGRDGGQRRGLGPGAGGRDRFINRMASEQNVEGELLARESRAAVRAAVAALPVPLRRLIERRFFEDVSVARLAEELGITRQGIYMRQRQALRQLRAALSVAGGVR